VSFFYTRNTAQLLGLRVALGFEVCLFNWLQDTQNSSVFKAVVLIDFASRANPQFQDENANLIPSYRTGLRTSWKTKQPVPGGGSKVTSI
jgi:hypothetical protein